MAKRVLKYGWRLSNFNRSCKGLFAQLLALVVGHYRDVRIPD